MKTIARFETERASRYLKALCHHFGRKVSAECSEEEGWVEFPIGRCELKASDSELVISLKAENQSKLKQLENIVGSHVDRFAFRENPNLVWGSPNSI